MSDSLRLRIGRRLRDLRLRIGDRQEDFAQRLGWSRPRLSKHERGDAQLTIEEALEIAAALGRPPLAVLMDLLPEDGDDSIATSIRHLQRTPALTPLLAALNTMPALVPMLLQAVEQELQAQQQRGQEPAIHSTQPDRAGDVDDPRLWEE